MGGGHEVVSFSVSVAGIGWTVELRRLISSPPPNSRAMKKLHYVPPPSSRFSRVILFLVFAQGFLLLLFTLTTHTFGFLGQGLSSSSWISKLPHFSSEAPLWGEETPLWGVEASGPALTADAGAADSQLQFLQREKSFLPMIYHNESTPALPKPRDVFNKIVSLEEFCADKWKNTTGSGNQSEFQNAVFRDAMLVSRQLVLPSTIDCGNTPMNLSLRTVHHVGRNSTPELEAWVVPDTHSIQDFEAAYSCHERVYEPAAIFALINWPQFGHALFNGISLLWEAFQHPETGPLFLAGKNVRVYLYGDALRKDQRQEVQQYAPLFPMRGLEPLMRMFSDQPARSLASLLMQSDRHPVCFAYLLVGAQGGLDHYNFEMPLGKWRDFARAVRRHVGARDPPRLPEGSLQREPESESVDSELGLIRPVDWARAGGHRPRITILDRRENRHILNVGELLLIAQRSGHFRSASVVYLEDMPVGEQLRLVGATDVLVGMDGTGLMTGLFMPEGGVVVHVRPFGCAEFLPQKGLNFHRLFAAGPGRVLRHESGLRNSTVFPTNLPERPELVFNHSSTPAYRFPFILRQDTLVDPSAFHCLLDAAARLLGGRPIDWPAHQHCTRSVFT